MILLRPFGGGGDRHGLDGWPEAFLGEGGARLRYLQAGAGADVVLVHGVITTAEDMVLALGGLAADRRVTAFDRPGYGGSRRGRLQGSPTQQAARLRDGVRALGLERPVLVGQSFGATVALAYGLSWPGEIAGLVLVSPLVVPEPRLEHLLFGARAVPGPGDFLAFGPGRLRDVALLPLLWEAMFSPQRMPERYRERFPFALAGRPEAMVATGEDAVQSIPELAADLWRARSLPLPVHILAGAADLVLDPVKHAIGLDALLPDSELTLLPGLGHMLHHFVPDAVADAVAAVARQGG